MAIECPLCEVSTDSIVTLLHLHVHCINVHPNQFNSCSWCTVPFATIHALKHHSKNCSTFHGDEPREGEIDAVLVNGNQCLVCRCKFRSNEAAIHHYKEQHLHFSYICGECEQYFQRKSALYSHQAAFHARPFEAREPSVSSANSSTPVSREQGNEENSSTASHRNVTESVICFAAKRKRNDCVKIKDRSHREKGHFMSYFNQKHCVECNIDFPNTAKITKHFKSVHRTKVLVCSCNRGYLSKEGFRHHRSVCSNHSAPVKILADASIGEKAAFMRFFNQLNCMECAKTFPNIFDIADHFKVKHRINVLLCDMCNKGSMSAATLRIHRQKAHNNSDALSQSSRTNSCARSEGAQDQKEIVDVHDEDVHQDAQGEYNIDLVKMEIESDHSLSSTKTCFNVINMHIDPNPMDTIVVYDLTLDD